MCHYYPRLEGIKTLRVCVGAVVLLLPARSVGLLLMPDSRFVSLTVQLQDFY